MRLTARALLVQHLCYMPFEDQCGYKYLLNSASIGYANKFKSLLLCGSVVIYVRAGSELMTDRTHALLAAARKAESLTLKLRATEALRQQKSERAARSPPQCATRSFTSTA